MGDPDRLRRFLRNQFRDAGRQYQEARRAFAEARSDASEDGAGTELRLVCRRYAERRSVTVDEAGRPACFEAGHSDCEGCAEDVRDGIVETWSDG